MSITMNPLHASRLFFRLPSLGSPRPWAVPAAVAAASLLGIGTGMWRQSPLVMGASAVGLCVTCLLWWDFHRRGNKGGGAGRSAAEGDRQIAPAAPSADAAVEPAAPTDPGSLIQQMLTTDRYSLLLRPQLIGNLSVRQRQETRERFERAMSLIPAGQVRLLQSDGRAAPPAGGQIIYVEPAFIDRYAVTNRQYLKFLEAGCYGDLSLWDEEALPVLIDLVDRRGVPGPAFWRDGGYPAGHDELPVVGVSWYEAQAYARWVGKRLPSDAEWVKAAAWPVTSPGKPPWQRNYPWGDEMDARRANVWGSGEEQPVAVDRYPEGASAGGVHQLVGNVWEWTAGDFGAWHPAGQRFATSASLRSLRGGSYDTYFPNHCTNHFQSGERPTSRERNIGFRCAVSACDLAPLLDEPGDPEVGAAALSQGVTV